MTKTAYAWMLAAAGFLTAPAVHAQEHEPPAEEAPVDEPVEETEPPAGEAPVDEPVAETEPPAEDEIDLGSIIDQILGPQPELEDDGTWTLDGMPISFPPDTDVIVYIGPRLDEEDGQLIVDECERLGASTCEMQPFDPEDPPMPPDSVEVVIFTGHGAPNGEGGLNALREDDFGEYLEDLRENGCEAGIGLDCCYSGIEQGTAGCYASGQEDEEVGNVEFVPIVHMLACEQHGHSREECEELYPELFEDEDEDDSSPDESTGDASTDDESEDDTSVQDEASGYGGAQPSY